MIRADAHAIPSGFEGLQERIRDSESPIDGASGDPDVQAPQRTRFEDTAIIALGGIEGPQRHRHLGMGIDQPCRDFYHRRSHSRSGRGALNALYSCCLVTVIETSILFMERIPARTSDGRRIAA